MNYKDPTEHPTVMQTNSDINSNEIVSLDLVNRRNGPTDLKSYYNMSLSEKLTEILNRSFCGMQNSLLDNCTKFSRCKKLYTGRESPIDLPGMKNSNKNIFKSKQYPHPALTLKCNFKKKGRSYKRQKKKQFSVLNVDIINTSQFNVSQKKRIKNQSSILNISKKHNDPVNKSSIDQFISSEGSNGSSLVNPVVCLKRLSKYDIQKYTKSNKPPASFRNPVVYLRRLSEFDVQKYMKSKKRK